MLDFGAVNLRDNQKGESDCGVRIADFKFANEI